MKIKTIGFLLAIGIILIGSPVGCKSKKVELKDEHFFDIESEEESSVNQVEKTIYDTKKGTMTDYNNIVKGDNEPFVLVKFIDENIKGVTEEEAIEMIMRLEEIQEGYKELYTDELFTEGYQMELLSLSEVVQPNNLLFDEENIEEIKNGDLKELVQKLIDGKYKLINIEGGFYPIIDYEALKDYDEYISEEIRDYIHIRSMDSNKPAALDAELRITFDELSERLIETENYILKYPSGKRYEELLRLYGTYLGFYIGGLDNSPIYDHETKIITDDVLNSYKKIIREKDTKTSQVVTKYMAIIDENENKIDGSVLAEGLNLKNQVIDELKK